MPEMLELLRNYLHLHRISFAYLDPRADFKEKRTILEEFSTKNNFLALLTSPKAASHNQQSPNSSRRFSGFTDICNVVFFDSANNGNGNVDYTETLEWCQTFNGITSLRVYKLVCEDTVEDSLSIQALQKSLGPHSVATTNPSSTSTSTAGLNFETNLTEPICKIKKHALEALFNTHFAGDNGVLSGKNVRF